MELVTNKEIGRRVAKARQEKGLSPEEFAEKANISLSFLQKIECGSRRPSDTTKIKIANALNKPVMELFF
jgi:transcriptional regulator with XRE-family HTH domain